MAGWCQVFCEYYNFIASDGAIGHNGRVEPVIDRERTVIELLRRDVAFWRALAQQGLHRAAEALCQERALEATIAALREEIRQRSVGDVPPQEEVE